MTCPACGVAHQVLAAVDEHESDDQPTLIEET